jgi:DNA-binding MarR family transcriptional regulator
MAGRDRIEECAGVVKDECLARRIGMVSRVVNSLYEGALAPFGITIAQFGLLTMVLKMDKTSPTQISKYLRIEKSTLSRNLKLMEAAGLLKLEGRGRSLEVRSTERGREVYLRSMAGWNKAQAQLKRKLKPEGVEAVAFLSDTLAQA